MKFFVFCIHNHQPVGNFPEVIEEAYQKSYRPFLESMSMYPEVRFTLHNTGYLLDWIVRNHPEYIELLKSMVERGQAEVMGGGYFEPVLSVIPEDDRISQILMMSEKLEELFGTKPRGLWLAERVWEPMVPSLLNKCGIEYLVVDDYHFLKAGLKTEDLGGYYITEDQGYVVKVFPGSERLRYLIPFKPATEFIKHMRGLDKVLSRGNAAIYGDDGEKFGVWPGTHKWVYEDGWLDDFLEKLSGALEEGWIASETMGNYARNNAPLGRIYLPTTSYMEMGEWALPPEASKAYAELHKEIKESEEGEHIERFLQGGNWRNFFSKYPESNWMHKRMLLVSRELRERARSGGNDELADALNHLYRAQCNDAYWHGIFGGLYMPHLRTSIYEHLLKAEAILDGRENNPPVKVLDLDADGLDEVIIRTRDLNLFFMPSDGGVLVELDFKPRYVNLANTLARWPEGYHHRLEEGTPQLAGDEAKSIHDIVLVKEEGLENYLKYDSNRRASFRDHFLSTEETLDAFYDNTYSELGDFAGGRYMSEVRDTSLVLRKEGVAAGAGFDVSKTFRSAGPGAFTVSYSVKRTSVGGAEALNFAVELNMLLPCCEGPVCSYTITPAALEGPDLGLGSRGVLESIKAVSLADSLTGIEITVKTDPPATLWRFPVHTVSLSEAGFEKIFQGSCLVFLYPAEKDMNINFDIRTRTI